MHVGYVEDLDCSVTMPPRCDLLKNGFVPRASDPMDFSVTTDPFVVEGWFKSLEDYFQYLFMEDADRVRCAIILLKNYASRWWVEAEKDVSLDILTWAQFKDIFYKKYFTAYARG